MVGWIVSAVVGIGIGIAINLVPLRMGRKTQRRETEAFGEKISRTCEVP